MTDLLALHEIKKTRVSEDIAGQLKALIAEGKLRSGDQLPSERELSERFKVSRASVREAIRTLESMGLLEARQGNGTYVATSVEALVEPLAHHIAREENAIQDLFEVRRLLEPQIAALAAERATPQEIEELREIVDRQGVQVAAGGTGADLDTAFHATLARAARNALLLRLNGDLMDVLQDSRWRSLATPDRPRRSLAGHHAILRALQAGDPKAANRAMLRHLDEIEANIKRGGGFPVDAAPRLRDGGVPVDAAARHHTGDGAEPLAPPPANGAGASSPRGGN